MRIFFRLLAILSVVAFVASCGPAEAGLEPRYVAVHNALTAAGLAQTGSISRGSLAEGGDARFDLAVGAGECHTVVALGGSGVDDLELRIVDESGADVAHDSTHDREAAVRFCASRAGTYQAIVHMAAGDGAYVVSAWSGVSTVTQSVVGVAARGGAGTCETPLPLELGRPVQGTTAGGANRTQASCGQGDSPEQVYEIRIGERAQLSVSLQSRFDATLYLLARCGDESSQLACNDDAGDTSHSRIDATVEPGTYFLVVDGYGSASGEYELAASAAPLRSLEAVCGDADELVPGRPLSGTTEGGADYFQATCAGGARSPDRVHRLDVARQSRVRIRQQSDHDGALHIRRVCGDAASEMACNDDFLGTRSSVVSALLDPGTYFVISDGFGGGDRANAGTFNVTAELGSASGGGATGDDCRGAIAATLGASTTVDTLEGADDLAGSCGGTGAADVVQRVHVTQRGRLRAVVRNAEFQGVVYIRRACADAASELACAPFQASTPRVAEAIAEAAVQPGDYFVVVDGASPTAFGSADVQIDVQDVEALERGCRTAPMLRPGHTTNGDTSRSTDRFQATCAGNTQSADDVYRIRLQRRSFVRVTMSSTFDGALHLRRDCTDASTEVVCNDDQNDNRHSQIEATLERGTYYLIVDGFQTGNAGSYSVDLTVERR